MTILPMLKISSGKNIQMEDSLKTSSGKLIPVRDGGFMKNAHLKDTFRELWRTRSRFVAIFAIIALGTGFFAGVKVTCPDMQLTADKYFEDYKLMDLRLVSTYGFNKDDVEAVKNSQAVGEIMPSYSIDAIMKADNEDKVAKLHCVPLDKLKQETDGYLNRYRVIEGRMPEKPGECAVEKGKIGGVNIAIGEEVSLSSGREDRAISDYLKQSTYKVVGQIETPYYLTFEKGTSNLGNGTVALYAIIPEEDFNMEVYTDLNITLQGTKGLSAFSEAYREIVKRDRKKFEDIAGIREEQRYNEVYRDAGQKLEDSKKELAEGEKEQQIKLSEALDNLKKGEADIKRGKLDLERQRDLFDKKLATSEAKLGKAESILESGEIKYAENLRLFEENRESMPAPQAAAAEAELIKTRLELDAGAKEITKQKTLFKKQKREGAKKLNEAALKLEQSEKTLEEGRTEYEKQKYVSDKKLEDARKEIAEAEQKVKDIKRPKWYIMDRNNNPGYTSYSEDTKRIDAIAKIFPVFFFFVAAFVCLTTMTRMVEEQRIQIGTLKALGYGSFAIASKYLVYAAIASITGSLAGLSIGLKLFPFVITNAYSMLYRLPPTIMPFRLDYVFWITLGALACTSLAVYLACYRELNEQPSALMRPKAPRMGKRVFLERIPFIWNRLNFFSKVTIRNLFRYKKRLFMTLLGVAGCTSLMLAGFGLRDAISSIVPRQYGEVFKFNAMIIIDENAKEQDKLEVVSVIQANSNVEKMLNVRLKNFDAGYQEDWQKINLIVPEDNEKLSQFISVHRMHGKKPLKLTDDGVIIGEKLAKVLNLKVGDRMTIKDGEFKSVEVKIAAINENYTLHYVYMTRTLFEKEFGEKPVSNSILLKEKKVSREADDQISSQLASKAAVLQMNFNRTNEQNFSDMVGNLNSIVFVMIFSAGALAFVVLYNLTNINITERVREIASIKVLGFYDLEVSEYVFRENIILTLINISIGLLGGIVLNRFVLETSEIDVVMFGRDIYWYSYLMAAVLTAVFAVLVNIVMHFKLKKISMIESLKSVE